MMNLLLTLSPLVPTTLQNVVNSLCRRVLNNFVETNYLTLFEINKLLPTETRHYWPGHHQPRWHRGLDAGGEGGQQALCQGPGEPAAGPRKSGELSPCAKGDEGRRLGSVLQ